MQTALECNLPAGLPEAPTGYTLTGGNLQVTVAGLRRACAAASLPPLLAAKASASALRMQRQPSSTDPSPPTRPAPSCRSASTRNVAVQARFFLRAFTAGTTTSRLYQELDPSQASQTFSLDAASYDMQIETLNTVGSGDTTLKTAVTVSE